MRKGFLIDFTRCTGCNTCMRACREANGLTGHGTDDADELDGYHRSVVKSYTKPDGGTLYYREMCMHCEDPACVSVCAVSALTKRPDGPVVYDPDRCFGCRYCMTACPFQIPKYTWDSAAPVISKCQMCYTRLEKGQEPACMAVCPTGGTRFGPRDVLLRIARERIRARPDRYVDHIFGEHEAGGTDVLMLSSVPFKDLGFHTEVLASAFPELTWVVQEKIPYVIVTGGFFLGGLRWIIDRRIELAKNKQLGAGAQ